MYVPQLLIGTRQEVVYGCEEEKGNAVHLMNEYEICNHLLVLVSETVVRSNYLFLYTKHRHTDLFFYFSLILLVDLMTIY